MFLIRSYKRTNISWYLWQAKLRSYPHTILKLRLQIRPDDIIYIHMYVKISTYICKYALMGTEIGSKESDNTIVCMYIHAYVHK